jgi:rhodanese-related sulfurtransferase
VSGFRRSAIAIALLTLGCSGAGGQGAAAPIEAQELAGRIAAGSPPVVLDVRTREEYARGHVPGAINIPHDELAGRLAELPGDRSEEIVVHCQSGRRAGMAEAVLGEHGYTQLRDLTGHWQGWQAAGLPSESEPGS